VNLTFIELLRRDEFDYQVYQSMLVTVDKTKVHYFYPEHKALWRVEYKDHTQAATILEDNGIRR
jgi:hypothetical protein